MAAAAAIEAGSNAKEYDPRGLTEPFGALGDGLLAPFARWDSVHYLTIAEEGYVETHPPVTAFYPLYPLLVRAAGAPLGSLPIGGVLVSMAAFLAALYLLHRLVTLELGPQYARPALLLAAFFPMAFFFSAVYSEALFLALSVGAVYAARSGRWAVAAGLGALAAATRNVGVLVAVPILILYLYGPRADRPEQEPGRGLRPRHPLGADALWVLAVPLGLLAFVAYLGATTGEPLAMLDAQEAWRRHFAGPLVGAWDGAVAAFEDARQFFGGDPFFPGLVDNVWYTARGAHGNLVQFGFLLFSIAATVGVVRRLPAAYGAYTIVSLAVPLSYPSGTLIPNPAGSLVSPLTSLSRFVAAMFPIYMWMALWATERRALRPLLVASALLMLLFTAQFAAWRFVA